MAHAVINIQKLYEKVGLKGFILIIVSILVILTILNIVPKFI